jgi:hypothetical protein
MSTQNSGVAVYRTHTDADHAVKELQRGGGSRAVTAGKLGTTVGWKSFAFDYPLGSVAILFLHDLLNVFSLTTRERERI